MLKFLTQITFKLMLTSLLLASPALAQSDEEEVKVELSPPVYDEKMMRLSEVLGALHYLRELCGADEGQTWRSEMQNLILSEEPTQDRRVEMVARFNQGFLGFSETYRECTPAAIEANKRYLFEGIKLSGEIPSRYGR